MGRSKPDGKCKKHPKHKQSPGVCSVCLSEKLSQLSTSASTSRSSSTNTMDCSSSSSLSSYYSSSSSCSYSSPMHRFQYPSQGKGYSLPSFFNGKSISLTKSRSVALVSIRGNKDCHEIKKKGGLWSKLLRRPKDKKVEEGLLDLGNILLLSLICINSEGSSILFALMIRQNPSLIAKKHAGIGSQFGAKVILTMSKKFLEVNVGHGFEAPSCGINEVQDC
ncbi:hypothetical protein D5086_022456 [Populus alba]|uniref:Uncharacterized protein n=1 Tax=Populus alba TaxID=43335 RepID=A0ACC4BGR2_POPAL